MAAVIPPLDATHQTPSSFDQLVVKFNQIAGPDPTPQGLLDAAAALTDAEIETLAASGNHKEPIENEQDEKIFALGMAEGLASPDGTKHMINAGDAAAEAARETRSLFRSLQLRIVQIDAIHRSGFLPQLIEIFTVRLYPSLICFSLLPDANIMCFFLFLSFLYRNSKVFFERAKSSQLRYRSMGTVSITARNRLYRIYADFS